MLMKNIETGMKNISKTIDKYSPEILLGCGIAGFISTAVLAAKGAVKAETKLDELHIELAESENELTESKIIIEEIKTVLPVYAPAIISGIISTGCVLGSYKISSKRTAAWATAYELTQASLIEYKDHVREKIGEKKEREIEHEIKQEHVLKDPPPESLCYGNDVVMGDGTELYRFRGHYFRIKHDEIFKAFDAIKDRLNSGSDDWIPLSELYWELGIRDYSAAEGDDYGFFEGDKPFPIFDAEIAPNGGTCQVIDFDDYDLPRLRVSGYRK